MTGGGRGGLAAGRRGECAVAPIHLLDPETDVYNEPFLDASLRLLPGYGRLQGVVTRSDETRETEELLDDPVDVVRDRLGVLPAADAHPHGHLYYGYQFGDRRARHMDRPYEPYLYDPARIRLS